MSFDSIQAVIFDKDGTLADSQNFLRRVGQQRARLIDAQIPGVADPLLQAFGLNGDRLNPAGLLAVGTRHENEIAAAAYIAETGRGWMEAMAIAQSAFLDADRSFHRKADHTPVFKDVLKLLQQLSGYGIQLGIISADSTANVQDFVDRYDLNSYFAIALGVKPGMSKSDPDLFQQACHLLGASPPTTLVIGDSASDVEMARAAGAMGCVGVSWGWTSPLTLSHADAIVHRVNDIQISP